jgi:hypothetical protein
MDPETDPALTNAAVPPVFPAAVLDLLTRAHIPAAQQMIYAEALVKEGFTSPEAFAVFDANTLAKCGITARAHVKVILKAIAEAKLAPMEPPVASIALLPSLPVAVQDLLTRAHIPVAQHANYGEALVKEGFTSPEAFAVLDEDSLTQCGITAKAHVKVILRTIAGREFKPKAAPVANAVPAAVTSTAPMVPGPPQAPPPSKPTSIEVSLQRMMHWRHQTALVARQVQDAESGHQTELKKVWFWLVISICTTTITSVVQLIGVFLLKQELDCISPLTSYAIFLKFLMFTLVSSFGCLVSLLLHWQAVKRDNMMISYASQFVDDLSCFLAVFSSALPILNASTGISAVVAAAFSTLTGIYTLCTGCFSNQYPCRSCASAYLILQGSAFVYLTYHALGGSTVTLSYEIIFLSGSSVVASFNQSFAGPVIGGDVFHCKYLAEACNVCTLVQGPQALGDNFTLSYQFYNSSCPFTLSAQPYSSYECLNNERYDIPFATLNNSDPCKKHGGCAYQTS